MPRRNRNKTKKPMSFKRNAMRQPARRKNVRAVRSLLEGQTNPFSNKARGQKMFDESSVFTNTATTSDRVMLTTDSNGSAAIQCFPYPTKIYRVADTIVGDVVTADGAVTASSDSAYIDSHTHMRIVSFGVRVLCICNADKAQGLLRISDSTKFANLAPFNTPNEHTKYVPITPGMDLYWTAKPMGAAAKRFIATDAGIVAAAAAGDLQTTMFDMFVSGMSASTPTLSVEIIVHYELLPDESDASTYRHASNPFPHIPAMLTAIASTVANTQSVQDAAELASGAAIATVAPSLLETISGFLGAAAESTIELAPLLLL
jgi:hypothetical protein